MLLREQLETQHQILDEQFDFLLKNYTTLDDTVRIKTSKQIFDLIRRLIQMDIDVIYPQATDIPNLTVNIPDIKQRHQKIEDHIEKILMIHVDEPEDMYINEMICLRELLTPLESEDIHTLTALEQNLSDHDKSRLHQQLSISLSEAQPVS